MKKEKLKNNLKKYRVWKNILQKDLAKKVGCSASQLRLIETNKCQPRLPLRLRICEFFGVSHDQMFYYREENDIELPEEYEKKITIINLSCNYIPLIELEDLLIKNYGYKLKKI